MAGFLRVKVPDPFPPKGQKRKECSVISFCGRCGKRGFTSGSLKVYGQILHAPDGSYAQIEELIVDESGRGKGVGARLAGAMIEEARRRGCKEIGLYSLEHTRPFYEKLGFTYQGPELRQAL